MAAVGSAMLCVETAGAAPTAHAADDVLVDGSLLGSSDGAAPAEGYLLQFTTAATMDAVLDDLDGDGVAVEEVADAGTFVASVDVDAAQAAALRQEPGVVAVEEDQVVRAAGTQASPPWGLDRVDQRSRPLDATYHSTGNGAGVTAYVLDSGLNFTHTQFTGRVPAYSYWDFGDGSGVADCAGHGTHVAGTIGGSTFGVATGVSIVPVKVLDCAGVGTTTALIAGIDWVIQHHVAGVPAVANISIGAAASSIVDSKVQALVDDGVTVVVAAGNSGLDTCSYSPARLPAAITVGATDIGDAVAPYSNHGTCNDLFAPGTGILSAFIGSTTATAVYEGTSMAAPHVAGAAALLLQSDPTASPAQVWSMLSAAATPGVLSATAAGDPNKLLFIQPTPSATLSVSKRGSGGGSVTSSVGGLSCGATCNVAVSAGTAVTLTAAASAGSIFVGWTGGGCSGTSTCSVRMSSATAVSAAFTFVSGPSFVALAPSRLLDTRPGSSTIDGAAAAIGERAGGTVTELAVAGRGGVDAGANAVALNVTVVGPRHSGFVTVFPCGTVPPNASNVNFVAGQTIANAVTTKIGANGRVCIVASQPTHVLVDVDGYYTHSPAFAALSPGRLMDTRTGAATIDGVSAAIGTRSAGTITELVVAGRGGVASGASAVVLNVTMVKASAGGYATVFPCGSPQPNASNLNFAAGQTIANSVTASLGADGSVCIFTSQGGDLIVDVAGYYTAGPSFVPANPARLMDTRLGAVTIDGQSAGIGARAGGTVTQLSVVGRGSANGAASAVVLNLTVVKPVASGFVTVFPCGSPRPNTSNLNFVAGATIPNAVTIKLGVEGMVCIFTTQTTNVVVDVAGYFTNA